MNLNYTPREVSEVIAQILAYDLKEKKSYSVYDPTVGSASSLLVVGECMETKKEDVEIQYFGQEINKFSYNLARMNLIINKVEYKNFNINHANTLEEDWPLEKNRSEKLPLKFDAIIANPPYSNSWKNNQRESYSWKEIENQPKSEVFDFNLVPLDPHKIGQIISSFCNTNGGELIFGMKEVSLSENEIVAINEDYPINDIMQTSISFFSPAPEISYSWIINDNKKILVIEVLKSQVPILLEGKKYIRKNSQSIHERNSNK
ncbi:N-6 DNA methylase [Vagococcus fluvialis]|uniref:N-6 DNA methylase n=1 Tax=Vagococcus fluvialis TaxID=2738 RepID=UPI0037BB74A3